GFLIAYTCDNKFDCNYWLACDV
ncbi:MAG: hypothetical protein K0S78_5664, partial [Thermomicrobiales bacterium]|nr:hypothetical protein [Thermomicrobiales bacterium]